MIFHRSYLPSPGFSTDSLCCFPTDAAYHASDWEAVMASRASLRIWSQSDWPEDTFTPEENREDLLLHVEDNANHSAYGYMLYNPGRTFCHGSVYVNPPDSLITDYTPVAGDPGLLDILQARVEYWTREAPETDPLEITRQVLQWIRDDWRVPACFTAREGMPERYQLYRTLGLTEALVLKNNDTGSRLSLFLIEAR